MTRRAGMLDATSACFTSERYGEAEQPRWDLPAGLRRQGRLDEAASVLEERVRWAPEDIMAHLKLFAARYRGGDFERAWPEYEWRTRYDAYARGFSAPRWDGAPMDGGALLVVAEQGLGDQIQFVRYARLARMRVAKLIVQCDVFLARLFRTCPGVDQVVEFGECELPAYDAWTWAASLPGLMGTRPDTIPAEVPYLFPDPERSSRWRGLFARFGQQLLVGINWQGNMSNVNAAERALPLEGFFPLARMDGVRLLSLQKGAAREQLANLLEGVGITDLGQHFVDMAGTAAAMEALDLVITNDTSLAHLAGALGRPVWLALPADACWRWQDEREDCPWYPTMRIFRRGWTEQSWAPVFERIREALEERAALHERTRSARAG